MHHIDNEMDYQQLIETMSTEVYRNLTQAVELGKWPNGQALTNEQRENAMQAIIAWGQLHLGERERVGYIDTGHKAGGRCEAPEESPLSWK